MKAQILFLTLLILGSMLWGQWTETSDTPNVISGGLGEQVMPKTAITADGKVYVCRFDNSSGGNYNVYLQLFSQQGELQWQTLVSDHTSMSWLTDYDMTVDNSGNAVIVFQDIRALGVNNVYVYKVTPGGTLLWAPDGITLSYDTSTDYMNVSPKVINCTDDHSYVAWQRSGGANDQIIIHRLSASGMKLWGENGVVLSSGAGDCSWPQLLESDNGDVLVKYFVDSGPYWAPTRHVYLARYNTEGVLQWNTTVSDAGGVSAWNQLFAFEPDGTGGAVLSWYDDRNNDTVNEIYMARINGSGTATTVANGALITGNTGHQQYYPVMCVNQAAERVYIFYKETGADQNSYGIGRQMLDYTGTMYWSDAGISMIPLGNLVANPLYVYPTYFGINLIFEIGDTPNSDTNMLLKTSCFRNDSEVFANVPYAVNSSSKYHFSFATHSDEWTVGVWEEGTSANDIYGSRLNRDGSLGMDYPAPLNLTATWVPPNSAELNWICPSNGYPPIAYAVYMNHVLQQELPFPAATYTATDLISGNYLFYVKAKYPGEIWSPASNQAEITIVANDDNTVPELMDKPLRVYPNPVHQAAEIELYTKAATPLTLSIYNLRGQKVQQLVLDNPVSGWNSISWHAPQGLPSGLYFLKAEIGHEQHTTRFIIK